MKNKIAERLTSLLKEENITPNKLAIDLQVSSSMVHYWLHGKTTPNAEYIIAIADYFAISADELFGREDFAGNVVVNGEKLTADEAELLRCYRALDFQNKNQAIGFLKGLAY